MFAKNLENPKVEKPKVETLIVAKWTICAKPKKKGSHYWKVKGDLKWSTFVIIVACMGTQD